ncbi:glycoside hydrolase family 19 protein [Variovorax sp. dw_308]|uniref:glycoside hydrolase family 19 protein n=1 Tax=Variovorax sp. dw_308 TaxID=2721546 RepID=UPI001C494F0B|nr:glycoside hydrolase family 19 protein [Variovorax sp. dw_308]
MDATTLARCTNARLDRAQRFAEPLTAAMAEFGIGKPSRQTMFLANIGHESGGLHYTVELWGPTEQQRRYEGRKDLGNTQPGDGFRYRGRGLIQTTGRCSYAALKEPLGVDYVADPERFGNTVDACRSACYFWMAHNLSAVADTGDFDGVCDLINRGRKTAAVGDSNGYAERFAFWKAAKAALGVA